MTTSTAATQWPRILREYSARNAGRRARLACDDPVLKSQWSEIDCPFRAVTYDSREDRIEITLAESGGLEPRLTFSIRNPIGIQVADPAHCQGDQLRIAHDNGCTLLVFVEVAVPPHRR